MNILLNYDYLKFESNRHSTFRMREYLPNIQYSFDGETFIDYNDDEIIDFEKHFIFNGKERYLMILLQVD